MIAHELNLEKLSVDADKTFGVRKLRAKIVSKSCTFSNDCMQVSDLNSITTLDNSPYSPDLICYDIFSFLKGKEVFRRRKWGDVEQIKHKTTRQWKNLTSKDI
ncbi:hypothetical protein AVEN_255268-1 [Araneus ventricosus]|uniref:Uncharacterized protein n=1 Tax=Araneus ventricosus TaxID=182803 RepID=A0A4Y2BCX3_ARAVE|nr:hypothetical protein AVEN_255268-1 [Araneus ventricosus]